MLNDEMYGSLHNKAIDIASVNLKQILDGTFDEHNMIGLSAHDVSTILSGLGAISLQDVDYNGWQNDFWETWEYQGRQYMFSGSQYYGTMSFAKKEKD